MTKKSTIFLQLIILFLISCRNDNGSQNEIIEDDKKAKIDSLLSRYVDLDRFSGTVLICNKKSITYHESFGFANYEANTPFSNRTAFKIGEVSELVITNIIDDLTQKGKFQLSDKVSKYLSGMNADYTISDLLNHQTNLPNIEAIKKMNPDMAYSTLIYANEAENDSSRNGKSDLNYNLLGLLIEEVSGKSFNENLLAYSNRLSLSDTYFQRTDSTNEAKGYLHYNYRGNGLELKESPTYDLEVAFSSRGIKSSAVDLSKIIHSQPEKDIEIFGYLPNDGFSYSVIHEAGDEIAIIVLSNRRHPVAKEISKAVNSILNGQDYMVPLRRNPVDINPNLLNDYVGKYKLNEFVEFEVIKEVDSLFVLLGPNKVALIPQSKNQFYMLNNDASMRFEEDSTNTVNRVVLLNGFIDSDEEAFKIKN